jgi:hypothetical protein
MLRGDLARINIITEKLQVIDSVVSITVLGKKFAIRVMEEMSGGMDEMGGTSVLWRL